MFLCIFKQIKSMREDKLWFRSNNWLYIGLQTFFTKLIASSFNSFFLLLRQIVLLIPQEF